MRDEEENEEQLELQACRLLDPVDLWTHQLQTSELSSRLEREAPRSCGGGGASAGLRPGGAHKYAAFTDSAAFTDTPSAGGRTAEKLQTQHGPSEAGRLRL